MQKQGIKKKTPTNFFNGPFYFKKGKIYINLHAYKSKYYIK